MTIAARKPHHRRFKVTSVYLTEALFKEALDRPNVMKYVGVLHEEGTTHVQGVIELAGARTAQQVKNMWPVDVRVQPLVGTKGDRSSWARYVRYLTHESPHEQAKGKYHYPDSAIWASEGYDWRAEVDDLTRKEGYKVPLLEEVKLKIIDGLMTSVEVAEEHPQLYARNYKALEQADMQWFELEKRKIVGARKLARDRYIIEGIRRRFGETNQSEPELGADERPASALEVIPERQSQSEQPASAPQSKVTQHQREEDERAQVVEEHQREDLLSACRWEAEVKNDSELWRELVQGRVAGVFDEHSDAAEFLGFTFIELSSEFVGGEFTLEGARMLGSYVYEIEYESDGYLEELLKHLNLELGREVAA